MQDTTISMEDNLHITQTALLYENLIIWSLTVFKAKNGPIYLIFYNPRDNMKVVEP